jgi:hypothetical protein
MSNSLTSEDIAFLEALEGIFKNRRRDTLLVRACDSVLKAYLKVLPEDRRVNVSNSWKRRKQGFLIEQGK